MSSSVGAALNDRGDIHPYITVRRMCASRLCFFFCSAKAWRQSSLAPTRVTFKTRLPSKKHGKLGPVRVTKRVDMTSHLIINRQLKAKKGCFKKKIAALTDHL